MTRLQIIRHLVDQALREKHGITERPPHRRRKPLPPHGTNARYIAKCRCRPCKDAHSEYGRNWEAARKAARQALHSAAQ